MRSVFKRFQQTLDVYVEKKFSSDNLENKLQKHAPMDNMRDRIRHTTSLYIALLNRPGDKKLKEEYKRQKLT